MIQDREADDMRVSDEQKVKPLCAWCGVTVAPEFVGDAVICSSCLVVINGRTLSWSNGGAEGEKQTD